ncbi:MAG: rhodanese-like domain-containing protein, partial [Burkholderiaceae bacterium]
MSLESAQDIISDTEDAAHAYSADPLSALTVAKAQAQEAGLPYSGTVPPTIAWSLFRQGSVVLVDVRTTEERHFVGHVPGSLHVAWATGTSLNRNPRFLKELESRAGGK